MKKNPTKPYSYAKKGFYSKIVRKWMKFSGEWYLKGRPGYKPTYEDLKLEAAKAEFARTEKTKKLLDFDEFVDLALEEGEKVEEH